MADKNIPGFHYARAVLSIFVVLWHAHAVPRPGIWSATAVTNYIPGFLDVINFQVLLIAVPGFVAISCFLFALHGGGLQRLWRQSARLSVLMLFWSLLFRLVEQGWPGLENSASSLATNPILSLVGAFGTVYYFFVTLTATLLITEICCRSSNRVNAVMLIAMCGLVVYFQWAPLHGGPSWMSSHWNPFNFAPYAPAMVLLSRHIAEAQRRGTWVIAACLLATLGLAAVEWAFLPRLTGHMPITAEIPAYTRLSLLPTSIALVLACILCKRSPGSGIAFMSRSSLALYCLHPIFLSVLITTFGEGPVIAAIAIAGSYLLSAAILPRFMPGLLYR